MRRMTHPPRIIGDKTTKLNRIEPGTSIKFFAFQHFGKYITVISVTT